MMPHNIFLNRNDIDYLGPEILKDDTDLTEYIRADIIAKKISAMNEQLDKIIKSANELNNYMKGSIRKE